MFNIGKKKKKQAPQMVLYMWQAFIIHYAGHVSEYVNMVSYEQLMKSSRQLYNTLVKASYTKTVGFL